jgi:hypothetical protein
MRCGRVGRGLTLAITIVAASVSLSPAAAVASAPDHGGASAPEQISLSISSLYSVNVAVASWVPVMVAVTDRGQSDVRGQLVLRVPTSAMAEPGTTTCYGTTGGRSFCTYGFTSVGGGFGSNYAAGPSATLVTYRAPLDLAAGTTKDIETDVLAESAQSSVQAQVVSGSDRLLASATAQLAVQNGQVTPSVLVVTDQAATLSSLSFPLPDGSQPQVQLLSAADVPAASAALGAFAAVVVDQADTSTFTPQQSRALEGYVGAGGTLLVAGGLGWRAAMAGFPAGFLPASVQGTAPEALPQLARLVDARPPPGRADVDNLAVAPGGVVTLSEGGQPLAVQARRGNGYVVLSAVDPAAAPLSNWAGSAGLASRLLATAYQYAYYGEGATLNKGFVSSPAVVPSSFSGQGPGPTSLMSPTMTSSVLDGYLEDIPGAAPPSAVLLGLLLLGYVFVAGPLCFVVLARLHRRDLAWVAVPIIAVVAGVAAYITGAGMARDPVVDEVQVAQMAPGSNLASVCSLGAVYLPRGGSSSVELASVGPVADLGAGAGADLTVGAGAAPGGSGLTVTGPNNSLGGWAASEDTEVGGTVGASVQASAGALKGLVTNHLSVTLTNVYVVEGSSNANLGTLAPGASVHFSLAASSQSPNPYGFGGIMTTTSPADSRRQVAVEAIDVLAAEYANANDGGPVLVGLASRPFLSADAAGVNRPSSRLDAVVVPLVPTLAAGSALSGITPELVASRGSAGVDGSLGATSNFTLAKGGFFDYQYLLPGRRWQQVHLDLGTPLGPNSFTNGTGPATGLGFPATTTSASQGIGFTLSAFDYRTDSWASLAVSGATGAFRATIAHPADYVGPGGAVELRLYAGAGGLEVVGSIPTLSANAARP